MRRSTLLALVLAACALGGLALQDMAVKPWFVALLGLAAVAWGMLVRDLLRRPFSARRTASFLGLALVLRLALLPASPFLSSDVYRYVWDGRVQAAGINPYLYVPADPALAALRDQAVYPNINRAETARTIYAPAAQLVFAALGRFAPGVTAMKAAMVGFEALSVLCLLALLRLARLPASRVLIYALNPLALWAFAGNGHVDALAIGFLTAAMAMAALRLPVLTGVVFACAVLTKFLPVVVFPALWRRAGWRMPVAALVTAAGLYGLYAEAGSHVLGFLPGYAPDEGLTTGVGFWLLAGFAHLGALPAAAAAAYAAALLIGLAALALHVLRRAGPADGARAIGADAALLAAALTVGISPHYPWYFAWLGALAVLAPSRPLLWLSASPVLLYLNPFGDQFIWPSLVYLPAAGLALAELRLPLTHVKGRTT